MPQSTFFPNKGKTLEEAVAIRVIGNTAPSGGIADGKYVYLIGHSTLPDGGYKANGAIQAGESLTSSNLTAIDGGLINAAVSALNSNLANVLATVEIGSASGLSSTEKEVVLSESMGNFVLIAFCIGWQNTGSGFFILPSEYASWSEPKRIFLNNNPSSAYAIVKSNSGSPTKLNVSATDTNIRLRVLGIMRKS